MTMALWDWGFELEDVTQHFDVFYGDADDIISPEMPAHVAERLPDATPHVWPGAGHYGFVDRDRWTEFLGSLTDVRVADRWFVRTTHDHGITHLVEPHVHRIIRCNIWHVRGRDRDLVVDTGVGIASVTDELADLLDRPVVVRGHPRPLRPRRWPPRVRRAGDASDRRRADEPVPSPDAAALVGLRTRGRRRRPGDRLRGRSRRAASTRSLDADFDIDAFHTEGTDVTARSPKRATSSISGTATSRCSSSPATHRAASDCSRGTTGTLFAGDAIYDGPLIDFLPESDQAAYATTMERLLDLDIDVVHAGHDPSFGRERLRELATAYLERTASTG